MPRCRTTTARTRSRPYAVEEERLLEAGDLDAAIELNLAFLVRRTWPIACGPMVRRSRSSGRARTRRRSTSAPCGRRTLVAVGEHDKADFHAIAERLAREIPDAELAVIPGAGHLPSIERPDETAALVRRFLSDV